MPRDVLTVMRRENIPLTASEITDCVMVLRPGENRARIDKSVRSCLTAKVDEGLVGRVSYPNGETRFSIID